MRTLFSRSFLIASVSTHPTPAVMTTATSDVAATPTLSGPHGELGTLLDAHDTDQ